MNILNPLPTERMARKHRDANRKAMHKQVDALAARDRAPWNSEHRRQHDALARQRKERLTTAAGIIVLAILTLINCELAARCFDEPTLSSTGDMHVAQSTTK